MTNWVAFSIAFVLVGIIPLWFLNFTGGVSFMKKILITIVLAGVVYYSVEYGGAKRGFISR